MVGPEHSLARLHHLRLQLLGLVPLALIPVSSFRRCAAELGLSEEGAEKQDSVLAEGVVQAVPQWLCDRTKADDQWLVIVDNADNVS